MSTVVSPAIDTDEMLFIVIDDEEQPHVETVARIAAWLEHTHYGDIDYPGEIYYRPAGLPGQMRQVELVYLESTTSLDNQGYPSYRFTDFQLVDQETRALLGEGVYRVDLRA